MITKFNYSASATALTASITRPLIVKVDTPLSVDSPVEGGYKHLNTGAFNFQDLISFERAISFTAASFSDTDRAYDATATVAIEGFNLFNMIHADRIVVRVASSHPQTGAEPRITPIGCSFQGLRIAGYAVQVDLATDVFTQYSTCSSLRDASTNKSVAPHILASTSDPKGQISGTLVRSIKGLGAEIKVNRNAITIVDFGTIYLAQVAVWERKRTITMLHCKLGSSPAGDVDVCISSGNGEGN